MFVTDAMIAEMARRFGRPAQREFEFESTPKEMARIRASQKDGRNHDVTAYIRKGDRLIVIAKHIYPPGLFRSPSGGLYPGESFEAGLAREVAEETGCVVTIDRFLLTTSVQFRHGDESICWRSFVFMTDYESGDLVFTDDYEIREVDVVAWSAFERFGEVMRQSDMAGLHYRAALHETIVGLLDESEMSGRTSGAA
jgi:ADP-ribose pyrophosphatase YjhB (NUDIX family)